MFDRCSRRGHYVNLISSLFLPNQLYSRRGTRSVSAWKLYEMRVDVAAIRKIMSLGDCKAAASVRDERLSGMKKKKVT